MVTVANAKSSHPKNTYSQGCGAESGCATGPRLLSARVMHQRLFPRDNAFNYTLYYLALPLSQLSEIKNLAVDRRSWVSFQQADHGPKDGTNLKFWVENLLDQQGFKCPVDEVILVAMPRTLGYVFNPVSFWLCLDAKGALRAVLCEVNNTFGETHFYLCHHKDERPIALSDWLCAEKCFHVSPFMPRSGEYFFKFEHAANHFNVWIHYHDAQGRRKLVTALKGQASPLTARNLTKAAWAHPWVGVKTMALIHWQALKLCSKRLTFFSKPEQLAPRLTKTSGNLNKVHYQEKFGNQ